MDYHFLLVLRIIDMDSIIGAYYVVSSAFSIKHMKLLINCLLPEQHHTADIARLVTMPIVDKCITIYWLVQLQTCHYV